MPEVWKIDFYAGDDGTLPVRDWLDTMPIEIRGKVLARIELLRAGGPTLDYPYTSQIEGKLREARLRFGKTRFRVLYFSTRIAPPSSYMASPRTPQPLKKPTRRLDGPEWPVMKPSYQQELGRRLQDEPRQRRISADENRMG